MLSLLTQFGDSSSGLGALGLNGQTFLIQLVTFIIALLVLRQWAFKPILKVMNERREAIEKGVQLGQQMEKEKVELEGKVEKALHEARQQADTIIAGAQDSARQIVREAEDKAREKATLVLQEADANIVQNTARARQALEKELIGLVSDATEAIIDEKIDAKKDAELIERTIRERQTA